MEQEIRAKLDNATRDLNRVDYGRLPKAARDQYDQAKRFATQAEEHIRAKNLVYARTLADNSAKIAAELVSR